MALTRNPLTRPDWGGTDADIDLHIEEHLGFVDKAFTYTSKLAPYMNIRSLRGTNQARVDRLGGVTVKGRRSGETLDRTRIAQEKYNLTVDTVLYTRHAIDYFDDWTTSLNTRSEYAQADGTELAKTFDQACLIAAIKAADYTPPASLQGSFNPGILVQATANLAEPSEADADELVRRHRKSIETLINRDLGDQVYSEGVTFVTPAVFTALMEHKRLMNVEYASGGSGAGNDFARGRIAVLNGIRVMETPRLPNAAISEHPLGSAFDVSADEAKRQIVTLIPSMSLIAAQVQPLDAKYWNNDENFQWVLDTFQSYNIGARRPDSVAVVEVNSAS